MHKSLTSQVVKKFLEAFGNSRIAAYLRFHNKEGENENQRAIRPTKELQTRCILLTYTVWSHLGLNQGLPDYESGALTD